ncbi:unnamed protein product [Acanthoscelides obtectus]|nr:unnamed protein product [Acanthoscelides obtectus]CAK1637682.1 hypothetical protein AOBTE_LOCUS10128 [Acanthoscelides obtectus]
MLHILRYNQQKHHSHPFPKHIRFYFETVISSLIDIK